MRASESMLARRTRPGPIEWQVFSSLLVLKYRSRVYVYVHVCRIVRKRERERERSSVELAELLSSCRKERGTISLFV